MSGLVRVSDVVQGAPLGLATVRSSFAASLLPSAAGSSGIAAAAHLAIPHQAQALLGDACPLGACVVPRRRQAAGQEHVEQLRAHVAGCPEDLRGRSREKRVERWVWAGLRRCPARHAR